MEEKYTNFKCYILSQLECLGGVRQRQPVKIICASWRLKRKKTVWSIEPTKTSLANMFAHGSTEVLTVIAINGPQLCHV